MGGFAYEERNEYWDWVRKGISPQGIIELLDRQPELLPDISEEAILDKGKSDGLAKALLIVQVGWFCINCLSRLIQHQPLTLLEVSTVAHGLCSLLVYVLWWNKPLNVTEPTIIPKPELELSPRGENLEVEATEDIASSNTLPTLAFVIIGLIYGGPHFLGWNTDFATYSELLLWRICTCVVFGTPCCFAALVILSQSFEDATGLDLSSSVYVACAIVYFPANLYLIAASFRQLLYLPLAAFDLPTWSNYFPHVS